MSAEEEKKMETAEKVELMVKNLPIKRVTVFSDRAEIKRCFPVSLNVGMNEVVVKDLPDVVVEDSIRVEGVGKATICEVQYQTRHETKEVDEGRKKELKEQLEGLEDKQEALAKELERVLSRRDIVIGLAQQLAKGPITTPESNKGQSQPVLGINSLQAMDEFLVTYEARVSEYDTTAAEKRKEQKRLEQEIRALRQNLAEAGGSSRMNKISREVSILVEGLEAGEMALTLSYVVFRASWTPSYDLRVFTNGDKAKLSVQYYGLVKQRTGEDWTDAKLCLSTAQPSVGGTIPTLKTLHVGFKPPPPPEQQERRRSSLMAKSARGAPRGALFSSSQEAEEMGSFAFGGAPLAAAAMLPEMDVAIAEVNESVISTNFEIARATTIPSDNTAHKVNVGLAELEPKMEYWSVPAKSSAAYLKARVVNTSPFALLPGPASVFLDNNFVAKTEILAVSPNESFSVSLGIDYSIRVDYKPVLKHHQETGMLNKSSVEMRVQKIKVKNTRNESVSLTLLDHLPLSSDEKIKVALVSPAVTKEKDGPERVGVNTDNNVEWMVGLAAGEERVLEIKYSVETPRSDANSLLFREY